MERLWVGRECQVKWTDQRAFSSAKWAGLMFSSLDTSSYFASQPQEVGVTHRVFLAPPGIKEKHSLELLGKAPIPEMTKPD